MCVLGSARGAPRPCNAQLPPQEHVPVAPVPAVGRCPCSGRCERDDDIWVGRLPHHFSTFPKYNGTVLFDRNVPWRYLFSVSGILHIPPPSCFFLCVVFSLFLVRVSGILDVPVVLLDSAVLTLSCHLSPLPCSAHMSSVNIPSRFLVAFLFIPPPPRKASPTRSRRCIGIGLLNMAANGSAFVL
jgi:hypothetical protein